MLTDIQKEELLQSLSLDEKIGQMFCYAHSRSMPYETFEKNIQECKAGSVFISDIWPEDVKRITASLNKFAKIPPMIAADIEKGPGHAVNGEANLPHEMAWGACDDPELTEKAHIATAERCREIGVHWSFSPQVDISYNMDNPCVNIRTISDVPECVARHGVAAVRGYQKNGMMVAGCKHFPGDGLDNRNQHFCTTVNTFDEEKWMNTYGYIYKEMIKAGTASIMVAHIALPAFDEKIDDYLGYPPASISYNLQTKLLRQKLGFEGCIVSDALSMIGACAVVDHDRLAIEFVKAGGDVLLFPLPEWHGFIKEAVLSGEIPMERIDDAVRRVITMKDKARLFENQEEVLRSAEHKYDLNDIAKQISEKSLCKVRDRDNILPLKLNKGDKILIINLRTDNNPKESHIECSFDVLEKELQDRGFETSSFINAGRGDFAENLSEYAAVLINNKISSQHCTGGSLRVSWPQIGAFWRAEILKHPRVIFTSFGDPYKLHDYPYLPTYINTFSTMESSQKAFVRALLGEIDFCGKNPVTHEGYFESEV